LDEKQRSCFAWKESSVFGEILRRRVGGEPFVAGLSAVSGAFVAIDLPPRPALSAVRPTPDGEDWEGTREGVGGDGGWPLYLRRFARLVAKT
jgi:hypothetical protein